jgi:hypothetical protein
VPVSLPTNPGTDSPSIPAYFTRQAAVPGMHHGAPWFLTPSLLAE